MNYQETKEEVWKMIQALNRLWTVEGKPEELKNYFHERMTVINPTENKRIEGGEACVAAWVGFTKMAKVLFWKEIDPLIEIYGEGNFAIVTYYFDMAFEMGGQEIKMQGRDLFSLVKENGKWWVVADEFSPNPNN